MRFIGDLIKPTQLNTRIVATVQQNEANFENDNIGLFPVEPEESVWLTVDSTESLYSVVDDER